MLLRLKSSLLRVKFILSTLEINFNQVLFNIRVRNELKPLDN